MSIAIPEVLGEAKQAPRSKSQRRERPMSITSGMTDLSRETGRKKKRVPLDVSDGSYRQSSLLFVARDYERLS